MLSAAAMVVVDATEVSFTSEGYWRSQGFQFIPVTLIPNLTPFPSMRFLFGLAASSTLLLAGAPLISIQPAAAAPVQCPDTWTGIKCDYYQDGYKAGRSDRKAGQSMAYERHSGAYDSRNASYYQAGYEEGWQSVKAAPQSAIQCPDTWTGGKCEYYKDGYKAGATDRKAGMSNAYERHAGAYDSRNASYYQAGYEAGWGAQ